MLPKGTMAAHAVGGLRHVPPAEFYCCYLSTMTVKVIKGRQNSMKYLNKKQVKAFDLLKE